MTRCDTGLRHGDSLYAVPGESEWTFYLNPSFERWGIPIGDDVRATEVGSFTGRD